MYLQHPPWLPVADVDGGAILLDQEHWVEASIGLPVHTREQRSAAVRPPGGCVQLASLRGGPHPHTLPQQAVNTQALTRWSAACPASSYGGTW